jgi:hypothetical protein
VPWVQSDHPEARRQRLADRFVPMLLSPTLWSVAIVMWWQPSMQWPTVARPRQGNSGMDAYGHHHHVQWENFSQFWLFGYG